MSDRKTRSLMASLKADTWETAEVMAYALAFEIQSGRRAPFTAAEACAELAKSFRAMNVRASARAAELEAPQSPQDGANLPAGPTLPAGAQTPPSNAEQDAARRYCDGWWASARGQPIPSDADPEFLRGYRNREAGNWPQIHATLDARDVSCHDECSP